jgi:glycosyltransferase involved in cell wall biosynthesis
MALPSQRLGLQHRIDHLFDWRVSRSLASLRPDTVVCYENAAYWTFRAAKALGAFCVLDAASIHFDESRRFLDGAINRTTRWIDQRKSDEILLADLIITTSAFAADSYVRHGVPAHKVRTCALGTEIPDASPRPRLASNECRFVFVGSLRRLKGADLLLDILDDFVREGVPAKLTIIGSPVETDLAMRASANPNVHTIPFLPHPTLFDEMRQHDCLVLPSRFDSFGMVVPEGMAVGLPAIVSDRVGAKSIILHHPGSGWVVPCEAEALKRQMLHLVLNRADLIRASQRALFAAREYSWPVYRKCIREIFADLPEQDPQSGIPL